MLKKVVKKKFKKKTRETMSSRDSFLLAVDRVRYG